MAVWLAFVHVAPVLAHAELVRSLPEANAALDNAPASIELFFSEALEPAFSTIAVSDARGAQMDNGDARLDPADPAHLRASVRSLPEGVYTVSWKAFSAVDGHALSGQYTFAVGNVSTEVVTRRSVILSLGEVLARWLLYLSTASLCGGTLFLLVVWQPSYQAVKAEAGLALIDRTRWRGLAALALSVLGLAIGLGLLVQAGRASDAEISAPWSQAVDRLLFTTRSGALWLARVALTFALAGLLTHARRRRDRWIAFGVSLLLLLTISLGSHAAAAPQPVMPILADWIHLLAASILVGGLVHLTAGLWAMRHLRQKLGARLTARMAPRLSALALVSFTVLAVTGLYAARAHVGALMALAETLYGRVLGLKLMLALAMLAVGVFIYLTRRAQSGEAVSAGHRLQRMMAGGTALGALLLLMAGILTALPPARVAATPKLHGERAADDVLVSLDVLPGRAGLNTFLVSVTSGGQPVESAQDVRLRLAPSTVNTPVTEVQLAAQGAGRYGAISAYLSLPDLWQVHIIVARAGKPDAMTSFSFEISGSVANGPSALPWERVTGALLLLSPLFYVFALRAMSRGGTQLVTLGFVPAIALFLVGLSVFYRPLAQSGGLVNPIPSNPQSISAGRTLFEVNCVPCHGLRGKGDGPVGITLNPRPADLTIHAAPGLHADGQLYEWITNGFPGNPVMPAFEDRLTNEERWHLVNYIRTLATQQP
jgi:copper transport protein